MNGILMVNILNQIKLKLGIDETLVQFNPIINSNVEYKRKNIDNNIWTKINSFRLYFYWTKNCY